MQRVVVNRAVLGRDLVQLPGNRTIATKDVLANLDRAGIPDGLPFLIEDDGTFTGVGYVNRYFREAANQRAYSVRSLRRFHSYNLARLLRHVRERRLAESDGSETAERVDLIVADRDDLVSYRERRLATIQPGSWNTELGSISSFFTWALDSHLISVSPIPRWGVRRRNTLAVRERYERRERFLTEAQLKFFLERGLRGDGCATATSFSERNYSFGLLLATTGLRREEGGLLLDCEVPQVQHMPTNGVWSFNRVGKGGVPRSVFISSELVKGIDIYRSVSRRQLIAAAQPRLRKRLASGELTQCEVQVDAVGVPSVVLGHRRIATDRVTNEMRSRLVRVTDAGLVEPLALFVSRFGTAPGADTWDHVFASARTLVAEADSPHRPPAHLTVTPHVFRHTYAVRMLSALMRVGRARANDPYLLLANPVMTVMALMGHSDVSTTQKYLYAAERYTEELPNAVREVSAMTVGTPQAQSGGVDLYE